MSPADVSYSLGKSSSDSFQDTFKWPELLFNASLEAFYKHDSGFSATQARAIMPYYMGVIFNEAHASVCSFSKGQGIDIMLWLLWISSELDILKSNHI
ncbi:uncharacterized protein LOC114715991 isoform X2 [Neltuma alba]|uniref:uncharacterized protein LOC114715991 isoform X2 n=1 Tax=Neltuma alba TaxID=207710 RepID=UPI0010A56078|nr:uncharacterized protein LOC114715991 isoform X2 [Prosopis alba]